MADIIVQPQVLSSIGPDVYDNLIPQQAVNSTNAVNATNATNAVNATNAIVNYDSTYSGFTTDSNGVLRVGSEIISKKVLIYNNASGATSGTLDINLNNGDIVEIHAKFEQIGRMHIISCGYTSDTNYANIEFSNEGIALVDGNLQSTKLDIMARLGSNSFGTNFSKSKIVTKSNSVSGTFNNSVSESLYVYKIYKIIE